MCSCRAGNRDPQIGLRLGEVQDPSAIAEHGGRRFPRIQPPLVHFADMGDELGLDAPGLFQEISETAKKLVVRNGFEISFVVYTLL